MPAGHPLHKEGNEMAEVIATNKRARAPCMKKAPQNTHFPAKTNRSSSSEEAGTVTWEFLSEKITPS